MRKLTTYVGVAAVAAAVFLATPLTALSQSKHVCSVRQTPRAELACAKAALHRDRTAARWLKSHRFEQVVLTGGKSHSLKYYLWRMRVDRRLIRQAKARLRPVVHHYAPAGLPPHAALWGCIQSNEGPWDDHDGGYDGGLQMSQGWLNMFSGSAGYYSQAQQEWFAEKAWAENHYAISFLVGQWFKWDGAYYCEKYA